MTKVPGPIGPRATTRSPSVIVWLPLHVLKDHVAEVARRQVEGHARSLALDTRARETDQRVARSRKPREHTDRVALDARDRDVALRLLLTPTVRPPARRFRSGSRRASRGPAGAPRRRPRLLPRGGSTTRRSLSRVQRVEPADRAAAHLVGRAERARRQAVDGVEQTPSPRGAGGSSARACPPGGVARPRREIEVALDLARRRMHLDDHRRRRRRRAAGGEREHAGRDERGDPDETVGRSHGREVGVSPPHFSYRRLRAAV